MVYTHTHTHNTVTLRDHDKSMARDSLYWRQTEGDISLLDRITTSPVEDRRELRAND